MAWSELAPIIALTLVVSGLATAIGVGIGVPLGTWLALARFKGRSALKVAVSVGMGIPPVLAGLVLLLAFWNTGPLGSLGLAFTPAAMVLAQALLAIPIAAGVTLGSIEGMPQVFREQLAALRLSGFERGRVAVIEAWPGVAAAGAAAFGRVVAEVGAVLIIGGNIEGRTRVLTTLIVQEARQARFGEAIAAGVVLLLIALVVNIVLVWFQSRLTR